MRKASFCFLCLIQLEVYCQYFDTIKLADKIDFIRHLKTNHQSEDALYFVNYLNSKNNIDTLKLYEVKLLLELRREKDADSLLLTPELLTIGSGNLECRYRLMKNHVSLMNKKFDKMIAPPCNSNLLYKEIWRVQLLAAAVLKERSDEFEMVFNSGKCTDPILSLVEYDLYILNMERQRRHKKSPFLAGIISALIPGAGKIYAGKPHEALHSFLPVAFNGIQAAEGYYYKKLLSPHFYFFGAVTTVFYASNIAGSVRASKRKNSEFNDKIRQNTEFEITKLTRYY